MRIVDRPGRIVGGRSCCAGTAGVQSGKTDEDGEKQQWRGAVDLAKLKADGAEMRAINGGEIGLIFQEPMTSFSPVHTVGNQIVEAIRLHRTMSKKRPATGPLLCCGWWACRGRRAGSTSTPTSSAAVCGSGR